MENKCQGFNTVFYYFNNYKCVAVERDGVKLTKDEDGNMGYTTTKYTDYVPEVLAKADFHCGNNHVIDKWKNYCNNNTNGTWALWKLYGDLDSECRRAMLEWIYNNYQCNVGL